MVIKEDLTQVNQFMVRKFNFIVLPVEGNDKVLIP